MFPVALLLIIMDSGFSRDQAEVRRELAGIEYAAKVLAVHHAVTQLQVGEALANRDMLPSPLLTPDPAGQREIVREAVSDLARHHDLHADDLGLSIGGLSGRGLSGVAAPVLEERVNTALDGTEPIDPGLIESFLLLSDTALNLTGVTQDSALDSNALIRAVLVHLPEVQRSIGDALHVVASYGESPDAPLSPAHTMALQTFGAILHDDSDRNVSVLIGLAVREDPEHFRAHPEVRSGLNDHMGRFQTTVSRFVSLLAANSSGVQPITGESITAGFSALEASDGLFNEGLKGIRILVADRAYALRSWRLAAIASSTFALFIVALLVIWISKSVRRSVNGIIAFTRKVSQGDYAASLQVKLSDDLYELYGHTRSMIDNIVTLAEFPRQNPNGVLAVGSDAEVIYRNPAVQQFIDERGVTLEEMLPESHRNVVDRLMSDHGEMQRIETSGDGYVLEWSYYPVRDMGLVHLYFKDITEQKRAEEQLIHDSFHDSLTDLPNRALFVDRLEQTLSILNPESRFTFAVFLIDLDRFKVINESFGLEYGDELLKVVAERLMSVTRPQDTVARFGGDEFGVLLPSLDDSREALHVAGRIHEAIREPVTVRGEHFSITCSIGIVFPGSDRREADSARRDPRVDQRDPQAILRDADSAMYSAKSAGKARSEIFNSGMYESAVTAMRLETELIRAVENGEIVAYFQPIVSFATGRIAGFEALARWLHPERGIIMPGTFIPLAEETGLIIPIGEQILRQAVEQTCAWRTAFPSFDELIASVNLSVRQFAHPSLMEDIAGILTAVEMDSHCLKLEITESGLMENVETSLQLLTRLKELNITLGIDDFGTGYSSLSYLHKFPFDTLKVDQSFVGNMEEECESHEIVTNVLSLAHGLGKEVIAEGIETEGQLSALKDLGAEYGQGYLFSRPVPSVEAEQLLSADPRW